MAYMSQEHKNKIAPVIKSLLKEYGVKATLAVRHHSTLVLNIQSGPIDFIGVGNRIARQTAERRGQQYYGDQVGHSSVNVYWIEDHYDGVAREFLIKAYAALKGPDFFDESDAQTDYFFRSHYQDINIGRYNKPYVLTKSLPVKSKKTVTVKAKAGTVGYRTITEVSKYDPRDNVAPDPDFSYVATVDQLLGR